MASGLLRINCSVEQINLACKDYGVAQLTSTSHVSTVTAVVFWQKMHLLVKHPVSITVLEPKTNNIESEDVRIVVAELLRLIDEFDPTFFKRNGSKTIGYEHLIKRKKK